MEMPARECCPVRALLLAAVLLVVGAAACTPTRDRGLVQASVPPACEFYKVGEVRDVTRPEIQRAMRRMGGDFVTSHLSVRGNPINLYNAVIYRYENDACRRTRR